VHESFPYSCYEDTLCGEIFSSLQDVEKRLDRYEKFRESRHVLKKVFKDTLFLHEVSLMKFNFAIEK
jgi:hypothetical protein